MKTKSEEVAADVAALLRARNSLLWVVSREEARAESYLAQAAASAGFTSRFWDCGAGVTALDGKKEDFGSADIGDTLSIIQRRAEDKSDRCAWILRDLPPWMAGPAGMVTCRQVRNLARYLPGVGRDGAQALIVISPSGDVPPELAGHATVIEWPMPDREEIAKALDAMIEALPEFETDKETGQPDTMKPFRALAAPNGVRDAAIDSAIGLTGEEAQSCFSKSIIQHRKIDPPTVAKEKKRVIAREKVLEWFDPLPGGLDAVGGLENLKDWLTQRKLAFSPQAREYGLPTPRGVVLFGPPGTGKTLTAKAIATAWGVPLLKLDIGALKGKFVGESEQNIRKAFRTIEAIGRCVVLIDEIEKALAGATQGAADGGVSADALGTILSWMSDRGTDSGAFIVATSNDLAALPPELVRAGRFDKIFLVDMPNELERVQVLRAALRSYGRNLCDLEETRLSEIVAATDTFTGSEIAAIVPDALFEAFADKGRQITVDDLVYAANKVTPLSKTAAEKITKLRDWARGKATPATRSVATERATIAPTGRAIDI